MEIFCLAAFGLCDNEENVLCDNLLNTVCDTIMLEVCKINVHFIKIFNYNKKFNNH